MNRMPEHKTKAWDSVFAHLPDTSRTHLEGLQHPHAGHVADKVRTETQLQQRPSTVKAEVGVTRSRSNTSCT